MDWQGYQQEVHYFRLQLENNRSIDHSYQITNCGLDIEIQAGTNRPLSGLF